MLSNNQKQNSDPTKPGNERRPRDLSKATAMHILGPSKNLNKENEGGRNEDKSSLNNIGVMGHSGSIDGVTKTRENRMI